MLYTLSFHQEGDGACVSHNRRIEKSTNNPNIDWNKTKYNVTLVDRNIRAVYKELFQDSVNEFNSRQKKSSRIIKNYYDKINQDSKKHTHYEIIIQIGSLQEGSPQNAKALLMNYAIDFMDRNPNLKVYGAYIHMDEGTAHLHLDYIPFARCNRGMHTQNSLTKALEAQGFKTVYKTKEHPEIKFKSAQVQWEESERNYLRQLCQNMSIDLHAEGVGRKRHFTVSEYKELKEMENEIQSKIDALQADADKKSRQVQSLTDKNKNLQSKNAELKKQLSEKQELLNQKKNLLDRVSERIRTLSTCNDNLMKKQAVLEKQIQNQMKSLDSFKKQADGVRQTLSDSLQVVRDLKDYLSFENFLSGKLQELGYNSYEIEHLDSIEERRFYNKWLDQEEPYVYDLNNYEKDLINSLNEMDDIEI